MASRENVMLIAAFMSVIAILALLVLVPNVPKEVAGFAIGIGGMFARNIGTAFDYEFGSSRGSKGKDKIIEDTISKLPH